MASPREIKRRIGSIRNTQKITKAMEMVASVKLRKARNQILNARPYAERIAEIASKLHGSFTNSTSPLLALREVKKIGLVTIGSDKGLCGGFNSNIVRKTVEFIREKNDKEIVLTLVGKKVTDAFRRRNVVIADKYNDVFFKPNYSHAAEIGQKLLKTFLSHDIDQVVIIYNEFKSTVSQKVRLERLLPVPPVKSKHRNTGIVYIFEPEGGECLDSLLSKYFISQIWRGILESHAAEQGARMAAMNGATKNAGELINKFTLFYNKARQASITKELLEVVSGAESLR